MSRVMDMACVALPACCSPPDEPPSSSPGTWYGLTAWLLCSLRLLAGRRLCQKHAVTLALRCTPVAVPWDARSKPHKRALLAAGRRDCFVQPTDSTHR